MYKQEVYPKLIIGKREMLRGEIVKLTAEEVKDFKRFIDSGVIVEVKVK